MKDIPITRIGTLMLIDDCEVDQLIYRRIAQKSGLVDNLQQYLSAAEALKHLTDASRPQPDLILLDINMPGMDGFEFLEAATELLDSEICPVVVMLTTSLNPGDERRAKSYDLVKEFLSKPLTHDHLKSLIRLIADRPAGEAD